MWMICVDFVEIQLSVGACETRFDNQKIKPLRPIQTIEATLQTEKVNVIRNRDVDKNEKKGNATL